MQCSIHSGTPDGNLATIWSKVLQYYEDHPCSEHYSNMKFSMFINAAEPHNHMPKLKGRAIEIRNLMPALAAIWNHYMDASKAIHQAVLHGLQCSARMDGLLDLYAGFDVLPTAAATEFEQSSFGYAQAQTAAGLHYGKKDGLFVFDVTIKTHYTLHQGKTAGELNPRLNWNYAGEDFMSKVRTLLSGATKGNYPSSSLVKCIEQYEFALYHQFAEFERSVSGD